jgi:heat shock protein HslJ
VATAHAQPAAQRRGQKSETPPASAEVPVEREDKKFPLGRQWIAVSLNGKAFTGSERPSITINDQYRATGFGGCNTFSATAFPLRDQGIAVGPLAITKKSCDKAIMSSEHAFFVAFRTAGKWDTVGGALIMRSQAGEIRFERSL